MKPHQTRKNVVLTPLQVGNYDPALLHSCVTLIRVHGHGYSSCIGVYVVAADGTGARSNVAEFYVSPFDLETTLDVIQSAALSREDHDVENDESSMYVGPLGPKMPWIIPAIPTLATSEACPSSISRKS